MGKIKVTKEQFENPCKGCKDKNGNAMCCTYIIIDTPMWYNDSTKIDVDHIYWMLTRKSIVVGTRFDSEPTLNPDEWEVRLMEICEYLTEDNKCSIYNERPHTCYEYSPFPIVDASYEEYDQPCERYEYKPDCDLLFDNPFSFRQYIEEQFGLMLYKKRKNYIYDTSKIEFI